MFPYITNINDVLPSIEGADEFVVAKREGFTVVNYILAFATTFPDLCHLETDAEKTQAIMRRECRGIIFDDSGKVISRPYAKFFNIGERTETGITHIDMTVKSRLLEKLDGSFLRPLVINDNFHMGTKMGITDVAKMSYDFLSRNSHYVDFMKLKFNDNFTPVFEFCSRKQRIVIDYPVERLVLTGIRHNNTGELIQYDEMVDIAKFYNIEAVREFQNDDEIQDMIARTRSLEDIEGYILRFDDGRMYKIKADLYCQMHSAKDDTNAEKNVIKLILNDKLDDVLPLMADDQRDFLIKYSDTINHTMKHYAANLAMVVDINKHLDRKDFALQVAAKNIDSGLLFKIYSGLDPYDVVKETVMGNLSTQTKVNGIRRFLGADYNLKVELDN